MVHKTSQTFLKTKGSVETKKKMGERSKSRFLTEKYLYCIKNIKKRDLTIYTRKIIHL